MVYMLLPLNNFKKEGKKYMVQNRSKQNGSNWIKAILFFFFRGWGGLDLYHHVLSLQVVFLYVQDQSSKDKSSVLRYFIDHIRISNININIK